jgi:hypothetical protein
VSLEPRGRFSSWLNRHPSEARTLDGVPPEVLGKLWADAWREGGWDTLRANTTLALHLGDIITRLEDLAHQFADVEAECHADRELEAFKTSAYWSSRT